MSINIPNTKDSSDDMIDAAKTFSALKASNIKAPLQRYEFEPYDQKDGRLITGLDVRALSAEPEQVRVNHWDVVCHDDRGYKIGDPSQISIASFAAQDTLDLLPWHRTADKQIRVIAYQSFRIPMHDTVHEDSGLRIQLPGSYILPENQIWSPSRAALITLAEKVGLDPVCTLRYNGGGSYSSSGWHTEALYCQSQQVKAPSLPTQFDPWQPFQIHHGTDFHGRIGVLSLSPQEVVEGFLGQQQLHHCVRLLESTFRFCRYRNIPLQVSIPITQEGRGKALSANRNRVKTTDQMRELARSPVMGDGRVAHVYVSPSHTPPQNSFIDTAVVEVTNSCLAGVSSPPYKAEIIQRRGRDSAYVMAYGWIGDELYLVKQRGPRPAVSVRNREAHFIHSDTNELHIDCPAGSFHPDDITREQRNSRVSKIIQEKIALRVLSEPTYVASAEPSPGYTNERIDLYFVEVDLSSSTGKPKEELFYIKPESELNLNDTGDIRDICSSAGSHMLWHSLSELEPKPDLVFIPRLPRRESFPEYMEFINRGSSIQEWLAKASLKADTKLSTHVSFRRLKSYMDNERGLVIVTPQDEKDRHHFRSEVAVQTARPEEGLEKWEFNFAHDSLHQVIGGFSALQADRNGRVLYSPENQPIAHDFDTVYQLNGLLAEVQVEWFSDDFLPRVYGLEDARQITWRAAFPLFRKALGIKDEEALELLHAISIEHRIPERVKNHARFDEFRDTVELYVYYSFLGEQQLRVFYENELRAPEVTQASLMYMNLHSDPEQYRDRIKSVLDEIRNYSEGYNPLRAGINRTCSFDIGLTALWLAHIKSQVESSKRPGWEEVVASADKFIYSTLADARAELLERLPKINSIDLNAWNKASFDLMQVHKREVIQEAKTFVEQYRESSSHLSEEQIAHNSGRLFPFYDSPVALLSDPKIVALLERKTKEMMNGG